MRCWGRLTYLRRILALIQSTSLTERDWTSRTRHSGRSLIDTSRTPNRVYVADTANNRVLGWSNITAFTTHAAADIVIGQPNPYTTICNNGGLSSTSLCD